MSENLKPKPSVFPAEKIADQACYVLITCGQPSEDGTMSVEMTYEGDPSLASYLLESAQGFIDEAEDGISH